MGLQSLEREILAEAKEVTGNKKLRMKDIMEWSTSKVKEFPEEERFHLPNIGVNISVKKTGKKG